MRVAIARGYKVYGFGNDFTPGNELSTNWPYHTPNTAASYTESRKVITSKKRLQLLAREKLRQRFSGNIDPSISYMTKSAYGAANEIVSNYHDSCVVFAHLFSDSAHIYPNLVFDTFSDWLVFTTKILDESHQKFS